MLWQGSLPDAPLLFSSDGAVNPYWRESTDGYEYGCTVQVICTLANLKVQITDYSTDLQRRVCIAMY